VDVSGLEVGDLNVIVSMVEGNSVLHDMVRGQN